MLMFLSLFPAGEKQKKGPGSPGQFHEIHRKNAYDFGLFMGYASFHSMVPHFDASKRCLIALNHARMAAEKLKALAPGLPIKEIKSLMDRYGYSTSVRQWNRIQASLTGAIIAIRNQCGEVLREVNRYWHAAYGLGINLAIAEAQFFEGEPAPRIVRTGLVNSREPALLLGLEVSSLDALVAIIDSGRPLAGHYRDLVAIREKYAANLRAP
jgi:hypothetical protein